MAQDMDPHILNFYEDYDLPISSIPGLIDDVLMGRLTLPKEKLDGQNFTFTVDDRGAIRFMGKGCPKWARAVGGLDRTALFEHYSDRPAVREAFLGAFDALQRVADACDRSLLSDLFEGGQRVMQAEVVTPINPNVVSYRQNVVCLIGVQDVGTKLESVAHSGLFQEFEDTASHLGTVDGWSIMGVPIVEFKGPPETHQALRESLHREWMHLVGGYGPNATMGDVLTDIVACRLVEHVPLAGNLLVRAARRLACDQPSAMPSKDFPTPAIWGAFKELDDERAAYVGRWVAPMENFFRKLGSHAIEAYDFKLADVGDDARASELRGFVTGVKSALRDGRVVAPTPQILRRIQSAAERTDESLFTRNVEGIVFEWRGRLRKLTGAFTAVNRLRGFFSFGEVATIV